MLNHHTVVPAYVNHRRARPWLAALIAILMLCSCSAAEPTYADVRATAILSGCWPGNYPTPPALTVTPLATSYPDVHPRTSTALPTTTPLPRCTPVPGAPTLIPYPTPLATPVPYPTRPALLTQGGSAPQALLHMPRLHHVDIAVHPAAGWPVVASVRPDDGPRRQVFVRVYHPDAATWGPAQQVNPGESEQGDGLRGGVAVGITGDSTVHVAWGGGDQPNNPVWYARSADYGVTWSEPEQVATGCYHVDTMGTTMDGQIVVLASCSRAGGGAARPGIVQRKADGSWLPLIELPVAGQHSTLVVTGEGDAARVVVLAVNVHHQGEAFIAQRSLRDGAAWRIDTKLLQPPAGLYSNDASFELFRGIAVRRPDGTDAILFTWSVFGGSVIHALTSLDGGANWNSIETVAAQPRDDAPGKRPPEERWSAPAYDVRADRWAMIVVRRDLDQPGPGNGTHYTQSSVPGSSIWLPRRGPDVYDQAVPLISGARSASWTDTAQTSNASFVWLAWIDEWQTLWVRSVDLNLLIPSDQYPPEGTP